MVFDNEEIIWFLEQLKKAVILESPLGFIKKFRGKSRTHQGALVPMEKWARTVICESKNDIEDWSDVGRAIARVLCLKGMVSVTPISFFKGLLFVDSVGSALWLKGVATVSLKGGVVISLRRWLPKENMLILGKFK